MVDLEMAISMGFIPTEEPEKQQEQ